MKATLKENSLGLGFLAIFLAALVGQAFVGHAEFNDDQLAHHGETVSMWRFLTSSPFWVDVMENWQSEYLQFTLFILGTVWLVQRGSPESKKIGRSGRESDADQLVGEHARPDSPAWARVGGWRTRLYSNSLGLLMVAIFAGSWFAQLVTGRVTFNEEQLEHGQATLSLWQYAGSAEFWNRTLQNWQSEFLAVASMVLFAIWLRQRGSPESKPVGSPHEATDVEG